MPQTRIGEWTYSSTILDLGTRWRWVVSFTPLPHYPPGTQPTVPIREEAGWALEPVLTLWRREKSCTVGNRNLAVQYTDWLIPTPCNFILCYISNCIYFGIDTLYVNYLFFFPMALQPFLGPWPHISVSKSFYTDGRTPWTSNQPVARPLPIRSTTQTQKNAQTYKHPRLE
jgi:hypothetical protein